MALVVWQNLNWNAAFTAFTASGKSGWQNVTFAYFLFFIIDPNIAFHETSILRILETLCKLYKINYEAAAHFLEKWRNSECNPQFLLYHNSYTNSFSFYNHLYNFGSSEEREFSKLALCLVSILSSEASVERLWSLVVCLWSSYWTISWTASSWEFFSQFSNLDHALKMKKAVFFVLQC